MRDRCSKRSDVAKVLHFGLSEASARIIRRAHAPAAGDGCPDRVFLARQSSEKEHRSPAASGRKLLPANRWLTGGGPHRTGLLRPQPRGVEPSVVSLGLSWHAAPARRALFRRQARSAGPVALFGEF